MISCPSCHHLEPVGAIFCSECGAQLHFLEADGVAAARPRKKPEHEPPSMFSPPSSGSPSIGDLSVALALLDFGKQLPLDPGEYTLGRTSGQQPILPDIDLAPYQAYKSGVSRLHAIMKVKPDEVSITDLGSVNGTHVNGKKLPAHQPLILKPGDQIALGKLKLTNLDSQVK